MAEREVAAARGEIHAHGYAAAELRNLHGQKNTDRGTSAACVVAVVAKALERLDQDTLALQRDVDAEVTSLRDATTPEQYRRYLARTFGFVAPLERSLLDTPGLETYLDAKHLRKHVLLQHDLLILGMGALEIDALPQCMWIPWFDDVHVALGWSYLIERNTLAHPNLFRHLANVMPREAAFASSYLKCYAGWIGEMWQSFGDSLDSAVESELHLDKIVAGAKTGFRFFRRWRNTLDGNAVSAETVLEAPRESKQREVSGEEP